MAAILKARTESGSPAQEWEVDAYKFKPLGPAQLSALIDDNNGIAKYLRSTCVRILSSTQTPEAINRGDLLSLDLGVLAGSLDAEKTAQYQSRIMKNEQGFSIEELKNFAYLICNPDTEDTNYSEKLKAFSLKDGVKYYLEFYNKLPKINSAEDLPKLPEVTFVTDSKGVVIGEYSESDLSDEKLVVRRNRRLMPKGSIPLVIKQALVSVEDARFWNFKPKTSQDYSGHKGVDFAGLMRAMIASSNGDEQGGSTISMQLVKNLLLYRDVFEEHNQGKRSLLRKLKEYILVRRLEEALSKDEILNWYLNTIDFGRKSQGVVMAARSYFGKDLKDITLTDAAFLAALPKAPNALDPQDNFESALRRRNIVINAMKKFKFIDSAQKKEAKAETIAFVTKTVESGEQGYASYFVSAVERQMREWLRTNSKSKERAYQIKTPINHQYQKWAVESLQRGLLDIERSKGTLVVKPDQDRLPNLEQAIKDLAIEKNVEDLNEVYPEVFAKVKNSYPDGGQFKLGLVISSSRFALQDGTTVRRFSKDENRRKLVDGQKKPLDKWDVVLLQPIKTDEGTIYRVASYTDVQGAVVVLDNKTGAVLATSGGFSIGAGRRYQGAEGNRAFSAERQPGSTVKPFSYFAALMKGLSPTTVISNRNISFPRRKVNGTEKCVPWNFESNQSEASSYTLRGGLEGSRNRLTLNAFTRSLGFRQSDGFGDFSDVLEEGIDDVLKTMQRFGLYAGTTHACYPILLGTNEVSVVSLAGAYASIANGGVYKVPHVIESIEENGVSVNPFAQSQAATNLLQTDLASRSDERFNLFRIRTFLQGVVQRGTARSMSSWYRIIAGKTGTTNDNRDAWFAGFNKDITVVVWVGYEKGRFLGSKYEGARAALPIFKDFMTQYYEAHPEKLKDEFGDVPDQGVLAVVEPNTGYYITDEFQSDFEHYTGKTTVLEGAQEYFLSQAELDKNVKRYEIGSKIAGRFFFTNLSDAYRSSYQQEFDSKRNKIIEALKVYEDNYVEQRNYCRDNREEFPDHEYVLNACAEAKDLESYIETTKRSVGDLENYYLQTLGFE